MTTFIPTQEQIKQAQEYGNAAADLAFTNIDRATNYRAMYDRTMARFEREANTPRPGYIVNPAAQMWDWLVPDERGDGMGGNDPERCEAGGYG
jgi:hypothetical protein